MATCELREYGKGIFYLPLVLLVLLFIPKGYVSAGSISKDAWRYRPVILRHSKKVFGHTRYVSIFAAQIEQESSWNCNPDTTIALGCAQFTPDTIQWAKNTICKDLGKPDPYNINWSIGCMIRYDYMLHWEYAGASECDNMAFALVGYVGGPGWVWRDRRLTKKIGVGINQFIWFNLVELYSTRSRSAIKESRHYVRIILGKRYKKYLKAGYGGVDVCDLLR